jgi:hypothetical protein
MRRGLMFGLDVLLLTTASIAILILVTGGGSFEWHGQVVRAARARNPLWAFFALALLRWGFGTDVAFLARWPMGPWASAAARVCERLESALSGLSGTHARRVVLVILLSSAVMKIWNAYHYYGFDYGDDVEIHLMTFSKLQGRDLGVWNLRSPVYPLVFIYPIQRALVGAGVEERARLIFAGRLVVVGFSLANVWLCYRLGMSIFGAQAVGVLGAYLLAISRLHVRLGSTELPRTVSTTFLLLAFTWLAAGRGRGRAALAGLALGVAGSLRFSEAVFAIPVALQLATERRYRDLLLAGATALLAIAFLLGPGDLLFWPEMFFSLRHIVEFTLVRGESSRGVEPLAHYLLTAPWWSDPFMLFLIGLGWRAAPKPLRLWAFAPIAALSLFPHKEERYLVPVLPFLVLIAAAGSWRLLQSARFRAASRRPPLALIVLLGVSLLEVEGFQFRRSEAAIDVARFLAARDNVRNVMMEEGTTTTGATLYLRPTIQVVNLDARRLGEASYFWGMVSGPETQYVVLRDSSLVPVFRDLLRQAGFVKVTGPEAKRGERYRIFVRRTE